ncbi:hypothetical protein OROGR_028563 [Orobanche gracilis]
MSKLIKVDHPFGEVETSFEYALAVAIKKAERLI